MPFSGAPAAPCQLAPPLTEGSISVGFSRDAGLYTGPNRYFFAMASASAFSSDVKSIRSFSLMPSGSNGAGLVGNGCVADVFSPGTADCGTGRPTIGRPGWPRTPANTKTNPGCGA